LAELWQSWGIAPAAVMGHSVGEYAAACVAGILTLEDGLRLVAQRARLMQSLPKNGSMLSVLAEEALVARAVERFASVSIAAINGPRHVVISGETAAVEEIAGELGARRVASRRLAVSHAFHSPLMQPMVEDFARVARTVHYGPPLVDVVSNVSGRRDGSEMGRPEYWSRHVLSPVRFADGMASLGQLDVDLFLEIGPQPILISMGRQCLDSGSHTWLPSLVRGNNDWTTMLEGLASFYTLGAAVDWRGFDRDYCRRRVTVPTYPFQRQRYWLEEDAAPEAAARHPLLGNRLPEMAHSIGTYVWEARLDGAALEFLNGHRVMGSPVLPYSVYVEMALAAMAEVSGESGRVMDLELQHPLFLSQEVVTTIQVALSRQPDGQFSFRVYQRAREKDASNSGWTLCASASIHGTGTGERRNREIRTDVLCQQ
jgi:acyl transferase domain-containing protein